MKESEVACCVCDPRLMTRLISLALEQQSQFAFDHTSAVVANVRDHVVHNKTAVIDAENPISAMSDGTAITPSGTKDKDGKWQLRSRLGQNSQPLLLALAALAALPIMFRTLRKRRKRPAGAVSLLEKGLAIPSIVASNEQQLLAGLRLVVSSLFDLAGSPSKHSDAAAASTSTAEAVDILMHAGAELIGRTATEELNLGLLGDSEDATNPAAPECSVSGCSCGPAVLVANGLADIGLGADHLAGVRVQSAMFGLSGFRPTPRQFPERGVATVTGASDSVGWVVQDPALHVQIADVLRLPGAVGTFSNTELVELVIASEVFELHGCVGSRLKKVALAAAKKWAGAEQTASGLLVTYLQKNVQAYKSFVGYENDADDVMEGIRRAAVTLQYVELLQRHGHLLEEAGSLRSTVLEQLERAQEVCEEEVKAAEHVAAQTSSAMRAILRGSILILPAMPSPQPAQGSTQDELKKWERGTLQLAALATLTGCPQATLPVPTKDGEPPLALSLLSLPKTDQRLAQITAALAPLVRAAAANKTSSSSNMHSSKEPRTAGKAGTANGKTSPSPEALAQQEALKEAGNAAFKAGNYREAIEKYTLAIKANPSNGVIYSNRAQALIKVGRFQEAEVDCSKALQAGPNAKALLRRGTARAAVSDLDGAVQDFKHVLALEPTNRQARMELQNLKYLSQGGLDETGLGHMLGGVPVGTARSDVSF